MSGKTKIEWATDQWNVVVGCSVVSPGCTNCYAMRLAGGRLRHTGAYAGLTSPSKAGPVWNGKVRLLEDRLGDPLRWTRPRRIFVNSMGDLFHEDVTDEWIDRVLAIAALCPQHRFLVLTKRAERMRRYCSQEDRLGIALCRDWPLPNLWLGVSVESRRALERLWHLAHTPATVRFASFEPLLEGASPAHAGTRDIDELDALTGRWKSDDDDVGSSTSTGVVPPLDWVICGGESGPGARPMHPDWARSLRDQCQAAGVPFFFKQWGEWSPNDRHPHRMFVYRGGGVDIPDYRAPDEEHGEVAMARVGKKAAGRLLDNREWSEVPDA